MTQPRLLVCTDLDRTLVPNGLQPESPAARGLFARFVAQDGITLTYVSGRDLGLVEAAITDYELPVPDFALTDVGTRIYAHDVDRWRVWSEWDDEIASDWEDYDHATLAAVFADVAALTLQETSKQNAHKLSYYFPANYDQRELEAELLHRLAGHHALVSFVLSIDEVADIGLCDVVPASATKLHAIQFLRARLGFALEQTVFAGDSGNDLAVLTSEIPAVLVANATDEVRAAAIAGAQAAGNADALYCARGGYLGLNGNYGAGILEGIAHYHHEHLRVIAGTSRE